MAAHAVEPPGRWDRRVAVAVGPELWTARHCQKTRRVRKGDPPRGGLRAADVCGALALDRGDRADLRGSGDGGDGRAADSRSGPRPCSAGCSRRGPDRSACRWRRGPDSAGISPVSASPWGDPRPTVRRDEDTTDDVPGSRKTCDNPGWSSLCALKTGARPLEGSEWLLRVLTCFWQTVGYAGVRTHWALSTPAARPTATAGSALRAEARPSVERGVRPGVKDPWIRKSPVQAPERNPRQLSARCSEKAVST